MPRCSAWLNENRKSVYLTDGGHIENLGIYELLKRSCRVIIAVDAEADPEMAFGSFNTLVRYRPHRSRHRDRSAVASADQPDQETNAEIEKTGDAAKHRGPHCAIGRITYSWAKGRPDRTGILIYIKASLTGDENDYVYHYKKRYWAFPHETTLDQMFSEEQFEAYRALGYHATNGLFTRRDDFAANRRHGRHVGGRGTCSTGCFPARPPASGREAHVRRVASGWIAPKRAVQTG